MEISQEIIAKSEPEVKLNLADDVMRLLNVQDHNSENVKDWLIFISTSNFKITAGEIYLAFKMAISRQIFDSEGKEIELFAKLNNNTTGKVIYAYLKYKKENLQYQSSKDKLKALKTPVNEITENEKSELRENLLKMICGEIKETGFSGDAWHLYFELEESGKINPSPAEKSKLYKEQLKKYELEEKRRIKTKFSLKHATPHINQLMEKVTGKQLLESVSNKCRSIVASNYLKQFTKDYETFKSQIK